MGGRYKKPNQDEVHPFRVVCRSGARLFTALHVNKVRSGWLLGCDCNSSGRDESRYQPRFAIDFAHGICQLTALVGCPCEAIRSLIAHRYSSPQN
jgi:hypothetical protein